MRLSSTPWRLHKRIKKCCKAGSTILLKVVTEIAQTFFFAGTKQNHNGIQPMSQVTKKICCKWIKRDPHWCGVDSCRCFTRSFKQSKQKGERKSLSWRVSRWSTRKAHWWPKFIFHTIAPAQVAGTGIGIARFNWWMARPNCMLFSSLIASSIVRQTLNRF